MSLPRGWAATTLGEIGHLFCGQSVSAPEVNNCGQGISYITGPEQWDGAKLHLNKWTETPKRIVPEGSIFITVKGAGVGKTFPGIHCAIGRDIYAFKPEAEIDLNFAHLAIKHQISSILLEARGDIPGLSKEHITDNTQILPPAAEQRRIVAKLDALTARISRARAELDRVPVLAEKLRQSVVVDAFSGRLTEELRRAYQLKAKDNEHLDNLFARKTEAKRKKPAAAIDWQPKLAIPDDWRWVSVDRVLAIAQYGSSSKTDENSGGVPVLRMGNIQSGELDFSNLKYLPLGHHEFPDLLLTDGDVLFNRTNSFELVGKSAVFRGASRPMSYASYLIRLRCCGILPDLLVRYLNSPLGRSWIESVASQQVGQANVNGTKLRSLGIPLPPEEEQAEMKRLIDLAFVRADRLEAEAARALKLLSRLESSILAKAFRGELVPQDEIDEPAEKLLERIRAERAAAPKPKRGRSKAS